MLLNFVVKDCFMNAFFLKPFLLPIIEKKDCFSVSVDQKEGSVYEVKVQVASSDMKRLIGFRGRLYRAIKILLKYYFKVDSVNLTIDLWDEKSA